MLPAIKASVTACVMCGTPLPIFRPHEDVLCRSLICAGQHAALPAAFKCSECTRPLTPALRGRGYCDNQRCRDEVLRRQEEKKAAARAALLHALQVRRARSAAQRGITREEQATYRVSLLPYNNDRVSRIATRRRELHEAHLRACLAEARQKHAAGLAPAEELEGIRSAVPVPTAHTTAAADAESQLLLAACAACRGVCCRKAGNRAYISADTMLRHLYRAPDATDDAIVAEYLRHIGERTMTHGCVYQGDRGCTLAPDLRADICHTYLCTGLRMLLQPIAETAPGAPTRRAYFAHGRLGELSGDRFVEVHGEERADG